MKTFNPLSLKLLKTLTPLVLVFFVGSISAAEGGPCKDYGDCDEFKYSLNDTESLQRVYNFYK